MTISQLASAPHDLQVVADEQVAQVVRLLQIAQQIDDLRLHGHVERRGGLVEHHEARAQDHRPSDGDALALTAGKLVRIAIHVFWFEPHFGQHFGDPATPLLLAHVRFVDAQTFLDDLQHGKARRQAAVRVLEDNLHVFAQRRQTFALERR